MVLADLPDRAELKQFVDEEMWNFNSFVGDINSINQNYIRSEKFLTFVNQEMAKYNLSIMNFDLTNIYSVNVTLNNNINYVIHQILISPFLFEKTLNYFSLVFEKENTLQEDFKFNNISYLYCYINSLYFLNYQNVSLVCLRNDVNRVEDLIVYFTYDFLSDYSKQDIIKHSLYNEMLYPVSRYKFFYDNEVLNLNQNQEFALYNSSLYYSNYIGLTSLFKYYYAFLDMTNEQNIEYLDPSLETSDLNINLIYINKYINQIFKKLDKLPSYRVLDIEYSSDEIFSLQMTNGYSDDIKINFIQFYDTHFRYVIGESDSPQLEINLASGLRLILEYHYDFIPYTKNYSVGWSEPMKCLFKSDADKGVEIYLTFDKAYFLIDNAISYPFRLSEDPIIFNINLLGISYEVILNEFAPIQITKDSISYYAILVQNIVIPEKIFVNSFVHEPLYNDYKNCHLQHNCDCTIVYNNKSVAAFPCWTTCYVNACIPYCQGAFPDMVINYHVDSLLSDLKISVFDLRMTFNISNFILGTVEVDSSPALINYNFDLLKVIDDLNQLAVRLDEDEKVLQYVKEYVDFQQSFINQFLQGISDAVGLGNLLSSSFSYLSSFMKAESRVISRVDKSVKESIVDHIITSYEKIPSKTLSYSPVEAINNGLVYNYLTTAFKTGVREDFNFVDYVVDALSLNQKLDLREIMQFSSGVYLNFQTKMADKIKYFKGLDMDFKDVPFGVARVHQSPIDILPNSFGKFLVNKFDGTKAGKSFLANEYTRFPFHTSISSYVFDIDEEGEVLLHVRFSGVGEPSVIGPTNLKNPRVKLGYLKMSYKVDMETEELSLLPFDKTLAYDNVFYSEEDVQRLYYSFTNNDISFLSVEEQWEMLAVYLGNRIKSRNVIDMVPIPNSIMLNSLDNLLVFSKNGNSFGYSLLNNNCQSFVNSYAQLISKGFSSTRYLKGDYNEFVNMIINSAKEYFSKSKYIDYYSFLEYLVYLRSYLSVLI